MSESTSPSPATPASPTPALPVAARRLASAWLRNVSRQTLAALVLAYIVFIHVVGLGIFSHGFLLSRITIPAISPAYTYESPAPLTPTHTKAVIIVIDALRTDFISPYHPSPASPYHHGVLTLPAELTLAHPAHSVLLNTYSDPPTTTMQRLKGITTGSLPTFVDAGANFASTAIEEDSIVSQLVAANKSIAFMGDDTWANLFPDSFTHSHPYDSFNVEDLHTVDNGVIKHLIPYLQKSNQSQWDVLIGHFLGVDHVGHRVGPERETMKLKLQQLDSILRQVVDLIDDETLLVVLGDHGMDSKGNHGGDSDLETAAAMWLYSKGAPINGGSVGVSLPTYIYPSSSTPIRHANQIDIVPTLSLLLGVPIPFNSLGSVIPECFSDSIHRLDTATRVNAEQIERFVEEYGNRDVLSAIAQARRHAASDADETNPYHAINTNREITRVALEELRALWAQFSVPHILIGLAVLALGVPALIALYLGVRNGGTGWDIYVRFAFETALTAAVVVGSVVGTVAGAYTRDPAIAIQTFLVAVAAVSELVLAAPLFLSALPRTMSWQLARAIGPMVVFVHAISFSSNSFVMWEDRVVVFLLVTIAFVHLLKALTAPTATMRLKLIGYSIIFAVIVRVVGTITVCREEQQPYCSVTFYDGSSSPKWALVGIIPAALMVFPRVVAITLSLSKSFSGPAPFFIGAAWRGVIVANALYWILEFTETWDRLQPARIPLVKFVKLWLARASLGISLGALPYLWFTSPLCIEVIREEPDQTGEEKAVTVYGFANAYGATYLLFLLVPFALVHLVSYPAAQITLAAIFSALLFHLELVDTQRDALLMQRSFASSSNPGAFDQPPADALVRPVFTDVVPLVLLGLLGFFATGHQAVLATIQWKAAFVGFETVTYPWSPILVILNTWGPTALSALAVPLVALWNVSPRPGSSVPVLAHTLQLSLAFIIYHTSITLASALCAAWLRRHLMVWKVFAPRFMLAGVTLVIVDVALIIALTVGVRVTSWKVWRTFRSTSV